MAALRAGARLHRARQDRQDRRRLPRRTPTACSSPAGSGVATLGIPGSAGVPAGTAPTRSSVPCNDERPCAPSSTPTPATSPPSSSSRSPATWAASRRAPATSQALRELTRAARRAPHLRRGDDRLPRRLRRRAGALRRHARPDLPRQDRRRRPAGRRLRRPRDIMASVAPLGPVYQAGTLSGNPLAMAAGLKMLEILAPPRHLRAARAASAQRSSTASAPLARERGIAPHVEPRRLDVHRLLHRRAGHRLRQRQEVGHRALRHVLPRHARRAASTWRRRSSRRRSSRRPTTDAQSTARSRPPAHALAALQRARRFALRAGAGDGGRCGRRRSAQRLRLGRSVRHPALRSPAPRARHRRRLRAPRHVVRRSAGGGDLDLPPAGAGVARRRLAAVGRASRRLSRHQRAPARARRAGAVPGAARARRGRARGDAARAPLRAASGARRSRRLDQRPLRDARARRSARSPSGPRARRREVALAAALVAAMLAKETGVVFVPVAVALAASASGARSSPPPSPPPPTASRCAASRSATARCPATAPPPSPRSARCWRAPPSPRWCPWRRAPIELSTWIAALSPHARAAWAVAGATLVGVALACSPSRRRTLAAVGLGWWLALGRSDGRHRRARLPVARPRPLALRRPARPPRRGLARPAPSPAACPPRAHARRRPVASPSRRRRRALRLAAQRSSPTWRDDEALYAPWSTRRPTTPGPGARSARSASRQSRDADAADCFHRAAELDRTEEVHAAYALEAYAWTCLDRCDEAEAQFRAHPGDARLESRGLRRGAPPLVARAPLAPLTATTRRVKSTHVNGEFGSRPHRQKMIQALRNVQLRRDLLRRRRLPGSVRRALGRSSLAYRAVADRCSGVLFGVAAGFRELYRSSKKALREDER